MCTVKLLAIASTVCRWRLNQLKDTYVRKCDTDLYANRKEQRGRTEENGCTDILHITFIWEGRHNNSFLCLTNFYINLSICTISYISVDCNTTKYLFAYLATQGVCIHPKWEPCRHRSSILYSAVSTALVASYASWLCLVLPGDILYLLIRLIFRSPPNITALTIIPLLSQSASTASTVFLINANSPTRTSPGNKLLVKWAHTSLYFSRFYMSKPQYSDHLVPFHSIRGSLGICL